jgi:hypothetical protein
VTIDLRGHIAKAGQSSDSPLTYIELRSYQLGGVTFVEIWKWAIHKT